MKYAIISDIHGNLEAFHEVLKKIKSLKGLDKVVCLGDIVGYGADPKRCIDLSRGNSDIIIAGNHDFAACGKTDIRFFNPVARDAAIWTGEVLNTEYLNFLKELPLIEELNNIHFAHGSLYKPEEWRYILSEKQAYIDFKIMKHNILFVGHSHVPIIFENKKDEIRIITDFEIELDKNAKYIINPGSIGQPRDFDPRASFAIYDSKKRNLEVIRLEYNIKEAQRKIKEAGLPDILAERLSYGR
jgi:putative phosphoesterase